MKESHLSYFCVRKYLLLKKASHSGFFSPDTEEFKAGQSKIYV
ncbi:hypothetical protein ADIS_2545 [Lunatimonas lonarensis]|uniref:Uncharacterized protein n=1 Tax=Lunatimonas lonarensis TaxID=1232681 RepID=R7ZSD9_9BACT|nr:hypothetical protein ADIS_2545 [Lunatimonas lonarensis]